MRVAATTNQRLRTARHLHLEMVDALGEVKVLEITKLNFFGSMYTLVGSRTKQ